MRRLGEFEWCQCGNRHGQNLQSPAFSPDGRWIAFYSASQQGVKRISVQGGAALRVCDSQSGEPRLGCVRHSGGAGLGRCGAVQSRRRPTGAAGEVEAGETVLAPQMLPGGDALLFTIASLTGGPARWDQARAVVQSLRTGERKTVLEGGSGARYVSTGHLIYAVGGIVFAAPFNLDRRELRGEAVPVVEGVRRGTTGEMQLAVSDSGALAYLPGPTGNQTVRRLAVGDRSGNITGLPVPPAAYSHVRVSPDGTRAALGVDDGDKPASSSMPSTERARCSACLRKARTAFRCGPPTVGGLRSSRTAAEISLFPAACRRHRRCGAADDPSGREEHVPESWSPDGRHLSFAAKVGSRDARRPLDADTGRQDDGTIRRRLVHGSIGSVFWPDGKWLAYAKGGGGALDVNRGVFLHPSPRPARCIRCRSSSWISIRCG